MRVRVVILAAALVLAPSGARGADLVLWWEQSFYLPEDEALAEIVAAFEQEAGKQVELVQLAPDEIHVKAQAALEAGQPPDFLYGIGDLLTDRFDQWAYEDRLVELTETLGPLQELFDADALDRATLLNGRTGRHGLYALPMGRTTNHVHVWKNLLERAGFTLADIPKEWDAFWAFWCDRVQPPCVEPRGATTSGGSGCRCRPRPTTRAPSLKSSSGPTPRAGRRPPGGASRTRR